VILNHLLNYRSIQQVDFEPPAEAITGAAVAAVCGGLLPGAREPFFLKRTVPFIHNFLCLFFYPPSGLIRLADEWSIPIQTLSRLFVFR
jgi:hypothetical protein